MRTIRLAGRITIVARDQHRVGALATRVKASGLDAGVGAADDVRTPS